MKSSLSRLDPVAIDQAIAECIQQIAVNPQSAQLQADLGDLYAQQQRWQLAIKHYRQAIALQPDFESVYKTLADLLLQEGKDEQAIKVYRQGVKNNPQNSNYLFALASALAAQKKWLRASNNFQQAAELEQSARVYYHWGLTNFALKEYVAAESCWQQAIALKENYALPYYQLGKLRQNQRQWQQAISAYQQAISINPEFVLALVKMGAIYRHLQQFDLAIACLRQAINYLGKEDLLAAFAVSGEESTLAEDLPATVELYFQLGKLLRAQGSFPEAITAYLESIQLDPFFKSTYIDLQYTPIAEEQFSEVIKVYRQIVSKHPEISVAWGNLGDALTQQDRVEEAVDCYRTGSYQQAIQAYPDLAKLDWPSQKKSGPDFIIAGAAKCGTSSIYHYLSRHPQVLLSHKKELDFYWQHYERGIDWYLAHFPTISDRPDFRTGEATPNYLRFPEVAQRIKDTFPQIKIIILLRNPVDRAISWHYHKLNTGLTKLDLATAIATEIDRLATVSEAEITNTGYYNPDNIMSSLYIYKLKPWMEILGREQFLILKSEDFYLNPGANMEQVFKFLDLPGCLLNNYPKVNSGSYQDADPALREILVKYFAPYNRQLEKYLGMEFGWE
ncbi:MAG: tetratricopeptide repeat protein [Pleurocapsa sp. SU_5_0]|nr:tetratricopeptide repeat protein [Pleurocapsa sp. SU_5_0]NJO96115.1 tetratricopeptide repeat protein [Pleurocapsa sp. CRU_1_2]NJR46171.1 tetratricopeptide repeat protein [Hyellaceae cyanobacterium CSU_1_1]